MDPIKFVVGLSQVGFLRREGIIVYKYTSYPSNIRNMGPYMFVVD
jgi:hypothetical protein